MADRIVTADRTPNWDKWRLIPDPALWQCVALSLNIDPDKARINGRDRDGGPAFNESREFNDRLYIARENLHRTLQCTAVVIDSPLESRVSLRQFATWARDIWDVPPELRAMANTPTLAEGHANVERRAHDKPATEARYREWQEGINKLAQDSPDKSHAEYCRTLSKQINVNFQTIRRHTKLS